ncbi:MAG TPA: metallophosphoesterase [Polyangiaceae bacterium]|nr:metallophosphoesterase [Polyangiaceae bacterium]
MTATRILVFVLVLALVVGGGHYYLYARLVRDTELPQGWARLATTVLVGMPVITVLGMTLARGPRALASPVAWAAFVWMGLAFFLLLGVAAGDVVRLGLRAAALASPGLRDPERRLFFTRVLGGAAAFGGFGLAAGGMRSALGETAVQRVKVSLRGLGRSGYRIVQISDVHVGPTIGVDFMAALVARINALAPDAVVITGDLVDGSVAELAAHVAPLRDLVARDGVFFVTGNHEYYSGADAWLAHLSTLGIRALRNERVSLGGERGFDLAGIDDASAHQFGAGHGADLTRALEGRDAGRPVVLLAHQPRAALEAAKHGVSLVLSGHTHGGQMFPWNHVVKLQQPFIAGLYRHLETQVYVSCGTGYWGPPMRVGAPAEITEIELVAA